MSRYTRSTIKDQRSSDFNDDNKWLKNANLAPTTNDFIQFLRDDERMAGLVNLRKVRQKLYSCSQIWKHIPESFKQQWHLEQNHFWDWRDFAWGNVRSTY